MTALLAPPAPTGATPRTDPTDPTTRTAEDRSTISVMSTAERQDAVDATEVRFVAPILGLEHLSRFALVELEAGSPLLSLQSLEDDAVRLLVLDPAVVVEGYEPSFDGVARAAVGLAPEDAGQLLVVVSPGESLADSTINLLAPVLVNGSTGAAAQVVLTGSDYPLRQPLAA